jgi:hypothetical protein
MENKSFASSYEKREQEIASIILNIGLSQAQILKGVETVEIFY